MERTKNWGEDRVYFCDDQGKLKSLPASWTDLEPVDAFVALSSGRALFRPDDLLRLAELLVGLDSQSAGKVTSEERHL